MASLLVSMVSILWLALEIAGVRLPFDAYKEHRIGTIASVLALILSIAAYWQPHRKRSMAIVAMTIAALIFAAYVLLVPL